MGAKCILKYLYLAGEILSVFVLLLLSSKASGALLGTDSVQSVAFHWESGACFEFLSFFETNGVVVVVQACEWSCGSISEAQYSISCITCRSC